MADLKQYVNVDPTKADERKDIAADRAGRTIKVVAEVSPKKKDVTVCFEIELGADNVVKSLDEANFSSEELKFLKKKKLTLPGFVMPGKAKRRARTNDQGKAELELLLSEHGGDEFEVKAYIPKKGGGKGPELKSDKYIVWRRVYFQTSRFKSGPKGANRTGTLVEIPALAMGPVSTEYTARKHNIELVDDGGTDLITRRCNVLEDDEHYKKSAKEGYDPKREPLAMRLVHVAQIASSAVAEIEFPVVHEGTQIEKQTPYYLWKDESLALGADWFVKAQWRRTEGDLTWKDLDRAYVTSDGISKIQILFQNIPKTGVFDWFRKARVKVTYRHLKGSTNGVSWYNAIWLAHENMHSGLRGDPAKQQTMIHEVGHFVGLVPAAQSTQYTGKDHQGGHCSTGIPGGELGDASYRGKSGTCVMFGENGAQRQGTFCATCDPSVRTAKVRIQTMPGDW